MSRIWFFDTCRTQYQHRVSPVPIRGVHRNVNRCGAKTSMRGAREKISGATQGQFSDKNTLYISPWLIAQFLFWGAKDLRCGVRNLSDSVTEHTTVHASGTYYKDTAWIQLSSGSRYMEELMNTHCPMSIQYARNLKAFPILCSLLTFCC